MITPPHNDIKCFCLKYSLVFTSCTVKTPGPRKPNPKTPPVQKAGSQHQAFRHQQSSPPEYKPEESELLAGGSMGQQSLESRLNKEYGSRKRPSPPGTSSQRTTVVQQQMPCPGPQSPVKSCPKYEPNDEAETGSSVSPTTPNYAPRTVRVFLLGPIEFEDF